MPRIAICTTAALVALFTACRDGAPTIDAPSTHRAGAIPLRAAGGGGGGGSTKYLTPTGQLDVLLDANPPARTRYRIDYHNGRVIPGDADVYAEGLDSEYCAYHDWIEFNGTAARIGFIGSPRRSPAQCAPQAAGPNGSYEADAAASLVAAEIFSALTDPYFDAWFDRLGLEGADKCAWDFGQTYKAANGALANIHLGLNDYLLQRFWVPAKNGGYCSMSAP